MKAVFITVTKDEAKRMIEESPSEKIFINFNNNKTHFRWCSKEYGKYIIQMHPGDMIFSNTPTIGSLELYDASDIDFANINVCPVQAILFPLRI